MAAATEEQAVVGREGVDVPGFVPAGEIGGRSAQQCLVAGDRPRHEPRVRRRDPDPDREIEPFFDDVDQTIGEADLGLKLGPGLEIPLEQGEDHDAPEGAG